MSIETALHEANRRVAALDFSPENERIADIDRQLADIENAKQRARERHEEVLQLLRPFNGTHHFAASPVLNENDGTFIADALLVGKSAAEAVKERPTREKLERERDALREALADLARRTHGLTMERDQVRSAAGRRTLEELRPLCEALETEARDAAQVIVRSFAALSALGRASNTNPPGLQVTASAIGGIRGPGQLVTPAEEIEVPSDVLALIDLLAQKGPSQVGRVAKTVQPPPHFATAALVTPRVAQPAHEPDRGWMPFRRTKASA